MKKLISFLLIFIISFAILLPVLLLPLVTSTPVFVYIPLLLVIIALLVIRFKSKQRLLIMMAGFVVVLILGVVASQYFATTPSINTPNSIAVLEQVELNGSKQWITIRGKDKTKPVLLYLGIGGPGAGGFPATATSLSLLEDHFVVVNWDQPGTGKSYKARPISNLTTQTFVEDARALTELMRTRFNQEKIYVMGLSWGTIVGTQLVHQYPELFYAYVGNGQMVNTVENDQFGFNLALTMKPDLQRHGPPPYEGKDMAMKYVDYNNVLFDYMGSPNIWMIMALVPQLAKEYGWVDKVNFDRGLIESFQVLYPQLKDLDFINQIPKVEVPMYFLVGEKDVNAVASIVERYYNVLEAPHKELIWVHSGHGATQEEIRDVLVNNVLVTSPSH